MSFKLLLVLACASMAQADEEAKPAAALVETGAVEKLELLSAEKLESWKDSQDLGTAEAQQMKAGLLIHLQRFMDAENKRKEDEVARRASRWAQILSKQQSALVEQEKSIRSEEKELVKLEREEAFDANVKATAQAEEKAAAQVENCAGQKTTLRALISSSEDQRHAACLKSQLGSCITTETTAVPTMKCDEPSAGWQKKCLADKAKEMADCAPLGVDWNAMRKGEKGIAADNAALQGLSEWCRFHRALGKIEQSKATAPFSLILSKDAALSKDSVQKLGDFGENFKQQEWDLLQVDPIGTPAKLHSVLVKTDAAEKIQKAMSQMKAVPLDKMPKAVNDAGTAKAVSWTGGVSGMLERESEDCSLQSPALLKMEESKLSAALR